MWGSGRARRGSGEAEPVSGEPAPGAPELGAAPVPRAARRRFWRPATHRSDDGGLLDPSVDLVGATVTQLRFDTGLTVALDASTHLRIEAGFELMEPDGSEAVLDPDQDPERMGALLRLLRKRVTEFAADTTGMLAITFSDGTALRCGPDDRFEAWELGFADGRLYVCLPGGEVAVWAGGGDSQGGS
jgi:hypothetical protein